MDHEELNQLVVRPVRPRIDSNYRIQRTSGLAELSALLLHDEPELQRVDVAARRLQTLFSRCLNGTHIAALQSFTATENKRMGRCWHERNLGDRVQTQMRRPAMVPASAAVV